MTPDATRGTRLRVGRVVIVSVARLRVPDLDEGFGVRAALALAIIPALVVVIGSAAASRSGGGGRITYVLTTQARQLYALAPGGHTPRSLTANVWASTDPNESPDGRSLLFAANPSGHYDIYRMALDGGAAVDLTADDPGDEFDPVWSPDGARIAFASDRASRNDQIYVMKADGTNVTRVTHDTFADELPSWSADGSRLAFDTGGGEANGDVYSVGVDGS